MADLSLLIEADRRGILPEDKKALLAEARNRGLVEGGAEPIQGRPDAAPAEVDEPGAGEYLLDRAKKGAAGFMGVPGDLLDMAANPPHPAVAPYSYLIRQAADKIGLLKKETRIPTEKVMANSAMYRDVTGVQNLKTENDALRYAGGVVEMGAAGGPLLAAKGVQAIPLAMSTVGAGFGMEAGGDVAEGIGLNRQAGEAVGTLAVGILPTLTGSAASGGVNYLKGRFSPSTQRAAAEATVARELEPLIADPRAQANLGRSVDVTDEFARTGQSFTPSLPARTGSPGLVAIEKDLVTRNPAALEKAVANVQKNEDEIAAFVNNRFPVAKQTTVQRIAGLQKQAANKLEGIRQAVDDRLDDLARVFDQNPNNYEVGKRVRDLVVRQKEVYRGMSGQRYEAVYEAADRLGVRANIDDVAQYADEVLKSEFNAYQQSEIPPVFRQLAKRVGKDLPEGAAEFVAQQSGKAAGEVSFAELHSLLKRTNSDLASLRGSQSADKGLKEHLLGQVKTRLEAKIAGFEDAGFGEVATRLKEANRFYREEYLPRFKQGFGADVLARYGSGEARVPNEQITGLITKSNNAQAAKDFKLLFDDVPEAWQSLRDGYMDVLFREKNALNAAGKIDQKVLDRFLKQHSQTLSEFPQIRNEFKQLALDNGALLERQARVVAAQKELAAADLYKLFQGKDPAVVIPEAVGNPNAMRVLVHKARNTPREGQALARAIAEDVVRQSDPAEYFIKNRETIRTGLQALGSDHFKNLETAIDAITINRRAQIPQFVQQTGVAPDPILAATGSSPRMMISHYVNIVRGRTGVNQEAAAWIGRLWDKFRTDHKAVAMEAVFYDKDVAAAFARLARQPQNPKFRADFANAMGSLGIRAEIAGQDMDAKPEKREPVRIDNPDLRIQRGAAMQGVRG